MILDPKLTESLVGLIDVAKIILILLAFGFFMKACS
jgi:hypothetical protein